MSGPVVAVQRDRTSVDGRWVTDRLDATGLEAVHQVLASLARKPTSAAPCPLVAADADLPFAVVADLIDRIGQSGFNCYQAAVLDRASKERVETHLLTFPPGGPPPPAAGSRETDARGLDYCWLPVEPAGQVTGTGPAIGFPSMLGYLGHHPPANPVPPQPRQRWDFPSQGPHCGDRSVTLDQLFWYRFVMHRQDPPLVYMSVASVSGGLDRDQVRRVVRRHLLEILRCYVGRGLKANNKLEGAVKVEFEIRVNGSVGRAQLAGSSLAHPGTESCIVDAVSRWQFPATGDRSTNVVFPFHFKPRGSD